MATFAHTVEIIRPHSRGPTNTLRLKHLLEENRA
jgi:hypothetical protein